MKIRFATKEYTATIHNGAISISSKGRNIVSKALPQAGKAIIAALYELEELQAQLLTAALEAHDVVFGADETPEHVEIEGGKYTYLSHWVTHYHGGTHTNHILNARLLRNDQEWINTDELEHKQFWQTLAGALHNARRRVAILEAAQK